MQLKRITVAFALTSFTHVRLPSACVEATSIEAMVVAILFLV